MQLIYKVNTLYIGQPIIGLNIIPKAMTYKVQFEMISAAGLPKMQQKINTWLTTGHLKKFEMHVLPDGNILFNLCMFKNTAE